MIKIMRKLNLAGQTLQSGVIVLAPAGVSIHGKSQWKCKCFCDKEFIALGSELRSGHTMSCGCYSRSGTFVTKHGHRSVTKGSNQQSPMYTLWMNLRARCKNPSHTHYADYGGRGISYPESWDSFETFLQEIDTAIGPKPPIPQDAVFNSSGTNYERYWSIDRINNDGNYELSNIRWATPHEQKTNQRGRRWKKKPEGVV
jgi:hypothetical protein